tara:strand:- start:119 stop:577 length:459 start_codon:yes stop_codon:yes gene_type:complete
MKKEITKFIRLLLFVPSSFLCGFLIWIIMYIILFINRELISFYFADGASFIQLYSQGILIAIGIYYSVFFSLKAGAFIAPTSRKERLLKILTLLLLLPAIFRIFTPALIASDSFRVDSRLFLTHPIVDKFLVTTLVLGAIRDFWNRKKLIKK